MAEVDVANKEEADRVLGIFVIETIARVIEAIHWSYYIILRCRVSGGICVIVLGKEKDPSCLRGLFEVDYCRGNSSGGIVCCGSDDAGQTMRVSSCASGMEDTVVVASPGTS